MILLNLRCGLHYPVYSKLIDVAHPGMPCMDKEAAGFTKLFLLFHLKVNLSIVVQSMASQVSGGSTYKTS